MPARPASPIAARMPAGRSPCSASSRSRRSYSAPTMSTRSDWGLASPNMRRRARPPLRCATFGAGQLAGWRDRMAKQRPSLEALAHNAVTSERDDGTTSQRENVVTLQRPARVRTSLPHVSVYIGKPVVRELKRLALDYDRKPHDLWIEALDLLLTKYGRPSVVELLKAR